MAWSKISSLLYAVFGISRFRDERYLEWLYARNPAGTAVSAEEWREGECLAHYAVLPQFYTDGARRLKGALSLNTAVSERARGQGVFTRLAEECYVSCVQQGIHFVLGVANANSTPGFLGRLGFTLLGPLPVRIGMALPLPQKGIRSWRLKGGAPLPDDLAPLIGKISIAPPGGWQQDWTPESLRWRLSSPATPLMLHSDGDALLVTALEKKNGLPVMIILSVFSLGNAQIKLSRLLQAACAACYTPLFITAGYGDIMAVRGLAVPRFLLPSPLNLIYRPLSSEAPPAETFRIGAFSFLDFDAY
jgi:hypothetical protein